MPGYLLLTGGGYVLVRTVLDSGREVIITGRVLRRRTWRTGGRRRNSRPCLEYLTIDDGIADETTTWGLPGRWDVDNALVLRAEWASGRSGRAAWKLNRDGRPGAGGIGSHGRGRTSTPPLPGIGDEANVVENRAVMRAGETTLVLIAVGAGRIGIPHLPWLLSRCAPGRLRVAG